MSLNPYSRARVTNDQGPLTDDQNQPACPFARPRGIMDKMKDYLAQFRYISRDGRLLVAEGFFCYIGIGVFAVIFNLYLVRLGYREDFIGAFQAVNVFGIGLLAIPTGMLCNRIGLKKSLVAGVLLLAVSGVLLALIVNPVVLLAVGFVNGVSTALLVVPQTPFLAEVSTDKERSHLFSANFATISLATTVGSISGGQLPSITNVIWPAMGAGSIDSFRFALIFGALLGAVGIVPLIMVKAKGREAARTITSKVDYREPVDEETARGNLKIFAISMALLGAGSALVVPFYNVYLAEVLHTPTALVGYIFAAASVISAFTSLACPVLYKRLGPIRAITWVRMITIPGFVAVAFFPAFWLAVSAFVVRMTFMNMSWPMDSTLIMSSVTKRLRATTVSFRSAAWNSCWAATSLGAGYLILLAGYTPAFLICCALVFAGAALQFVHFERQVRHARAEGTVPGFLAAVTDQVLEPELAEVDKG
jgi:MFS family permease